MNASSTIQFRGNNYPVKLTIDYGNGNTLEYEQVFFEHCLSIQDVRSRVYNCMLEEEPMFFGSQIVNIKNALHVTVDEVGETNDGEFILDEVIAGSFGRQEVPNEPA